MAEQVSVLISFKTENTALLEAQKQLNSFLDTIRTGMNLDIGVKFANSLMELPSKFREAVQAGVEYGETTKNMAEQTRTTGSAFQVLSLMATQTGVEVGKLVTTVQQMSQHTEEAVNGNEQMVNVFKRLGLNAEKFSALPVPLQLEAIAKAGASAGWSTQALDDIFAILGARSGPQMLGMLHQLADEGFKGAADEALKLGAVMDDKVTANLAHLAEQQKVTTQVWKVAWGDMANTVSPVMEAIQQVEQKLGGLVEKASSLGKGHLGAITQFVGGVIGSQSFGLGSAVQALGATVNDAPAAQTTVDPGKGSALSKTPEQMEKEASLAEKLREEAEAKAAASERSNYDDLEAYETEQKRAAKEAERLAHLQQIYSLETQIKAAEDSGDQIKADSLKLDLERVKTENESKAAIDARVAVMKQEQDLARWLAAITAQETTDKEKQSEIERQASLISDNAALSTQEKQQKLAANAAEYRAITQQIVDLETERLSLANNPTEVAKLQAEISRLKDQAASYGKKGEEKHTSREQQSADNLANSRAPDKNFQSIGGAAIGGMQDSLAKMAPLADHVHDAFTGIASTISGSITTGIDSALAGTESWSTALRNIANSILSSIVNAIVETIVQLTVAAGIAAILAALTGGASTAGGAAGSVASLFADGGFTSNGPSDQPAGIVHAGEWVAPAWMVSHPIAGGAIATLENIRNGAASLSQLGASSTAALAGRSLSRMPAFGSAPGGTGAGGGNHVNVMFMDDRQSAMTAMRRTPGQNRVVQIMRNGRGNFLA